MKIFCSSHLLNLIKKEQQRGRKRTACLIALSFTFPFLFSHLSFLPLPSLVLLIQLLPGLLSLNSQFLLLFRLPSLPPVPSPLSTSQSPSFFPFQALFVSPFSILMPLPPPFFPPFSLVHSALFLPHPCPLGFL